MEAITLLASAFDILLGLGLLWLAWRALSSPELFKAIVLFVAFGLLMALAWVRLDAPDVALAEAAIGAGLTGALLLTAFARLGSADKGTDFVVQDEKERLNLWSPHWYSLISVLLLAIGLGYVILSLPPYVGLNAEVTAHLETSGVSNPVTAVLLNFRGYDTLLEMVVLLIALLGVWSLGDAKLHRETTPGPALDTLSRLLTPVLILVAAYLLWVGADAPGGAFQAGSVLGAAGVLLILSGWQLRSGSTTFSLRLMLVVGASTFMAMAVLTLMFEGQLLKYPKEHAGILILALETAATLSIGVTLTALFLGGRPQSENSE